MAQLGVSELFSDPDFIDPITIIVRQTAVNSFGENLVTESSCAAFGSVQPASGKVLNRLPEAMRLADMSSFWVKSPIPISGGGKYPTILVFRGKRYQVQVVFDWSNFGPGYSEGVAVAERPS
jgi:hypothetical protein